MVEQVTHVKASARSFGDIDVLCSPALLLDGRFSAAITDDQAFADGCRNGFDGFYDALCCEAPEEYQPVSEVRRFLVETVTDSGPVWLGKRASFLWNVGYGLGWLSALARSYYQEAMEGLELLRLLVEASESK